MKRYAVVCTDGWDNDTFDSDFDTQEKAESYLKDVAADTGHEFTLVPYTSLLPALRAALPNV